MLAVSTALLATACRGGDSAPGDAGAATDAVVGADVPTDRDAVTDALVRADARTDTGPDEDAAAPDGAVVQADAGCIDVDRDGHCRPADCDDENAAARPSAAETCGNGADDNCDRHVDEGCLDATDRFYVDKDSIGGACSNSNPGTITRPWCTVDRANGLLTAGDTVYIRAGTYDGETIQPASSGTSDTQRITYTRYQDEVVTFTRSVYCVRLVGRSYVSILGLRFVDCERNLYLDASSHNNIGECSFDNPGGPVTWAGSRIYNGSEYNRIFRCTFSRYGNESGSDPNWDDNGAILDIGNDNEVDRSDHNLIEDGTFYYGGHHILGVYASDNVVRRNTFHNEEWYACHRAATGNRCGDRNVITNTSFPDENVRNVIEDNAIVFSGLPPDDDSSSGLSLRTQHNIVRRNVFYHNDSAGVALSADGANHNDASHNHIYANVFFHNGYPAFDTWAPTKYGLMLARWVDDAQHNPMVGVAIKNNVFHQNQLGGMYFYYVDRSEQIVADNWEEAGDPGFVSISGTPDPFDFGVFDFHLAPGSPCIDHGGFLTTTTGAGTDATTLVVEDAGYFTDGAGVVAGDMIQLEGQAVAVTITRVDHATNTLTVDAPLTWTTGTGVSQPYAGARPDQGAYEAR
ncbi:MAG: right-handed parallel beta-helix repeat-containing protein [Deltaproteobacteria bacterium]|nr:right-handed parallel beta-helix repeat-containing protein [Deltaproteobacteria bacterium]